MRKSPAALLAPESAQKLSEADVVLGVVGAGISEVCRQELNTSRTIAKPTIVMADSLFAQQLQREFPARMHKPKNLREIIRQVGVQAYRDSSMASIQRD